MFPIIELPQAPSFGKISDFIGENYFDELNVPAKDRLKASITVYHVASANFQAEVQLHKALADASGKIPNIDKESVKEFINYFVENFSNDEPTEPQAEPETEKTEPITTTECN
mgnify:CR=1 FL=1